MYHQTICKKDCIYREKDSCKFSYNLQNSIFHIDKKPCIYYSSKSKIKEAEFNSISIPYFR